MAESAELMVSRSSSFSRRNNSSGERSSDTFVLGFANSLLFVDRLVDGLLPAHGDQAVSPLFQGQTTASYFDQMSATCKECQTSSTAQRIGCRQKMERDVANLLVAGSDASAEETNGDCRLDFW